MNESINIIALHAEREPLNTQRTVINLRIKEIEFLLLKASLPVWVDEGDWISAVFSGKTLVGKAHFIWESRWELTLLPITAKGQNFCKLPYYSQEGE